MPEIAWILLAPLGWAIALLVFRRVRKRTQGYAERNVLKSRLPAWVASFEAVVLILLWIAGSLALLYFTIGLHGSVHPKIATTDVSEAAMVLMTTGSFIATLVPSMLVANLISWLVRPVRAANLVAMEGLPTTTFANANRGLALMGAVAAPVALAQALLGALEPWA